MADETVTSLTKKLPFIQASFLRLMGSKPLMGGEIAPGITRLIPGYSAVFAVTLGNGNCVLIDTGTDKKAKEIHVYLRQQNMTASNVEAIFLTHAHPDHIAGLKEFPDATVYVGEADAAVLRAEAKSDGLLPGLSGRLSEPAVTSTDQISGIANDQQVTLGNVTVTAFSVPGHTRGSMAYMINNVLFVGDAMTFGNKKAIKPPAPMSYDSNLGIASLKTLANHLESTGTVPSIIAPSHSGDGTFEELKQLTQSM